MSQRDLERAVSKATGESISTVRRLGFLLAEPEDWSNDDLEAEVIDWDELQAQRPQSFPSLPRLASVGC